jgi:hypothetical protein
MGLMFVLELFNALTIDLSLMGPMCVVHLFDGSMCLVSFDGVYRLDLCSGLVIAFVSI